MPKVKSFLDIFNKDKKEETVEKITGIKQEVLQQVETIKAKLDFELVKKKYGCIPKILYIGKSQVVLSEDELDKDSDLYKLYKKEGLVE